MDIVNGYVCHNCSDVALAKKGVDPAHPHDGPNGLQPQTPDSRSSDKASGAAPGDSSPSSFGPAVTYGGAVQGADSTQSAAGGQAQSSAQSSAQTSAQSSAWASVQPGQQLSLSA